MPTLEMPCIFVDLATFRLFEEVDSLVIVEPFQGGAQRSNRRTADCDLTAERRIGSG